MDTTFRVKNETSFRPKAFMTAEDQSALYSMLCKMLGKGGKEMDLASYALEYLHSNRWDIRCCPPIVETIIRKAFE